jgi:hypothetical protein
MDKIFYASMGCLITEHTTDKTFYLNGTQALSVDNNWNVITIPDTGKCQPINYLYDSSYGIDINIERVVGNYSDPTLARCTGPFLHKIFFENNTKPEDEKKAFFIKNLGLCKTGHKLTDLKEFSISVYHQKDNDVILENDPSRSIHKFIYDRCLLNSVSYSIDTKKITESLSFTGHSVQNKPSDAYYAKDLLVMNEPYNGSNHTNRLITPRDLSLQYSIFPEILNDVIKIGDYFDSKEVIGIKEVNINLGIEYQKINDEGNWDASLDTYNMLSSIYIPLNISFSVKFLCRKSSAFDFKNRPEFDPNESPKQTVKKYQFRLAFKTKNFINTSDDLFIIDLGKKNVLNGISYSGGSTSGDLVECEMQFSNFSSDFITYFTPFNTPVLFNFNERY